ncbi:hypothetical protein [Pseudonocardia sp. NPDC049635]|uniref:hypothetical protein n=1 Tax=Pseudonocardia sp. NPDC049635 TaxID=3155506 RepID=UPI0033F9F1B3
MRRAATVLAAGIVILLGGCGVTLEDEPEPYGPATDVPSPAPTVSVRPDDLPVDDPAPAVTATPAPTSAVSLPPTGP